MEDDVPRYFVIAISSGYCSRKRVDEVPKYLVTAISSGTWLSSNSGGPLRYRAASFNFAPSFAASRNLALDVPKYFVIAMSSSYCSINLVTVVSRY